jgi:hypothetical protein
MLGLGNRRYGEWCHCWYQTLGIPWSLQGGWRDLLVPQGQIQRPRLMNIKKQVSVSVSVVSGVAIAIEEYIVTYNRVLES